MFGRFHCRGVHNEFVGVTDNPAILDTDNAVGIFFRQLGVMGDHDHQPVFCHLLQQVHDLHTGFRVQRAGGFVRQENIRVVDQRAGDSHTLHLAAGHLIGALVKLIAEAHILQRLLGSLTPFGTGNTGDRQCQFHICQNTLVRNQVIALEHETDGMIAVGVPIPIGIFLCGNTVDDQIAAVITVQATNYVQKRRLSGATGSQNRHKFIIPQIQAYTVQRGLHQFAGDILLFNIPNLQHGLHTLRSFTFLKFSLSSKYEQFNILLKKKDVISPFFLWAAAAYSGLLRQISHPFPSGA